MLEGHIWHLLYYLILYLTILLITSWSGKTEIIKDYTKMKRSEQFWFNSYHDGPNLTGEGSNHEFTIKNYLDYLVFHF